MHGGRIAGAITLALTLSACASRPDYRPVADVPVKIGAPYTIRGVTYTPRAEPDYDMIGYASWYGSESGSQTANGERFRPGWITAAHTTLPLPSYVEVTALATGRTILVRVNDRGPFARGRVIDLSRGAAEALGVARAGVARVRVRVVQPGEADRARLRAGREAAARPGVDQRALQSLNAQFDAALRAGLIPPQ